MIWLRVGFIIFILAILALDLGILWREHKVMSARTALGWVSWLPVEHIHVPTAVWLGVIVVALALGVAASLVYAKKHHHPPEPSGPGEQGPPVDPLR